MRIEEPKTAIDKIILSRGHMRLIDVAAIHNRSFSAQDLSSPLSHEQQPRQKRFVNEKCLCGTRQDTFGNATSVRERDRTYARGKNEVVNDVVGVPFGHPRGQFFFVTRKTETFDTSARTTNGRTRMTVGASVTDSRNIQSRTKTTCTRPSIRDSSRQFLAIRPQV